MTEIHTIAKRLFLSLALTVCAGATAGAQDYSSPTVAEEGAWCWFADPRALHYENEAGTLNATYVGYIDVHGNVKATQYDWLTGRKTDVLVRSYFQPDDHDNPTFIVLPDERVMIFYTRHTDEAKIWYRISRRPGDISSLGDEKYLATSANTTYPSPFILSDDPTHIYLCWRGIGWHPTIARLTMPDANDDCQFDYGPYQVVQSTGARPYAKYQSNGKDKIYLSYTTGHPDNEQPNWLYFNVIDINQGNGPLLRDIEGTLLSTISNGTFAVSKTDTYATTYPLTVVDQTTNIRNWVWQITLDQDERPVIAYTHIDNAKTTHVYWYARWTGSEWRRTWVQYGGHAFHQNWSSTELCYSGGMAVDPEHINDLYLSIPTTSGAYDKDNGVYEIWKYTIDDDGNVAGSQQLTDASAKNNVRPFIIPGSASSPMRLAWMQGDYYYWIVKTAYPLGFPTGIKTDYTWTEPLQTDDPAGEASAETPFTAGATLHIVLAMDPDNYQGTLFTLSNGLSYSLNATTHRPELSYGGNTYVSQNQLYTSDNWATNSSGTSGDNWPTPLTTWTLSMTYDGETLTTYRNGLVDQVVELSGMAPGVLDTSSSVATVLASQLLPTLCQTPMSVQETVASLEETAQKQLGRAALEAITLPAETWTDIVLPSVSLGQSITWTSNRPKVIADGGTMVHPLIDAKVTLTATCGTETRKFDVVAKTRDISHNLRYQHDATIDMTGNTATGFATNTTLTAPSGLLHHLRSFTFLLKMNASALSGNPRCYDFGSASGNSLFLRANPLAAGVKYNGGTTTMVSSATTLSTDTDYALAVTFSAASGVTKIYINGTEDTSGTANTVEPYVLEQLATDLRNYIGRTQWWDGAYAADNIDFQGTISDFRLYDVCLTQQEICDLQGMEYTTKDLPTSVQNGDFEASYSVQAGSGVSSDRAIYVPEAWTVTRTSPNTNDITALKAGDLYYSNFFSGYSASVDGSTQSYWIRQNWGTPTLTLSQELLLPAGNYTLSVQVVQDGLGGKAQVSAVQGNGSTVTAPDLSNSTAWQTSTLTLASDGINPTTIRLQATHTSGGSAKIIGFDNVTLTKNPIYGDIDNDNELSIEDVYALVNILLGLDSTEPYLYNHTAADVNSDTVVNLADLSALIRLLLL